jgi:hypothetical protein
MEPRASESFWVIEQFTDGKSSGYWGGLSSREFTPDIESAIQFHRRWDAAWAIKGWHWTDVRPTEHTMMAPPRAAMDAPRPLAKLQAEWRTSSTAWRADGVYCEAEADVIFSCAEALTPHIAAVESLTRERDALRATMATADDIMSFLVAKVDQRDRDTKLPQGVYARCRGVRAALREAAGR